MDLAYDHIAEEALPKDSRDSNGEGTDQTAESSEKKPEHTLNEDLQEAYRAFSSSTWGTWLGGTVGNVIKQGGSVYREAQQEVTSLGADATRSFASLRARALSLTTSPPPTEPKDQQSGDKEKDTETTPTTSKAGGSDEAAKDAETVISRLRAEAAKRLKDIQRAEDAADEALLKFGGNIRDFFRDAIVVKSTPESDDAKGTTRRFESKDESGKRVIHTSRFDAQLHVIHTTERSFTEDPASAEYAAWAKNFDAESKTENISADLAKYPELRANMEKLVPGTVPYADFWKRYYFLRHSIETAEARRRDLLKAASAEEEIGWGEESDDDEEESEEEEESEDEKVPAKSTAQLTERPARPRSTESSTTIHPPAGTSNKGHLKPAEPRKSDEKSQADSDTSYDVVGAASGNPSQAPSSPKEARKVEDSDEDSEEDSDDEEWE
ncbi:BSD-domain-containing protein [Hypoxylon trugodes]|uniref:BSD-domain-containing protein n=1 Tax=Hypoxylon trugodes TaxID=326681 RepID=UPI00219E4076|nr:BSD-domain-containing protein [Hypoxylon trugodes]KAI1387258.1 BSD-domain-containing protein [Hypoxylon trugodes]